jgi:hypothetical protein
MPGPNRAEFIRDCYPLIKASLDGTECREAKHY